MDLEILNAMRQVMQEELAPVHHRLGRLEQGLTRIEQRQDKLEQGFARLEQRQDKLEQSFARLEQRQDALEEGQRSIWEKLEEQAEFERGTRILIENVDHNLRLLAEARGADAARIEKIDRIEAALYEVKSDVGVIKKVVTWHSKEISELKKAQ